MLQHAVTRAMAHLADQLEAERVNRDVERACNARHRQLAEHLAALLSSQRILHVFHRLGGGELQVAAEEEELVGVK
jgi:hypothetical protein